MSLTRRGFLTVLAAPMVIPAARLMPVRLFVPPAPPWTPAELKELVFWWRGDAGAELAVVEGYLAHKWGLPLPPEHPFHVEAPMIVGAA